MPHDAPAAAFPIDPDRVLAAKSVREPAARALFLAAVREFGRDGLPFTAERLQRLMAVEEHFQTLLLYDQLEILRGEAALAEGERDFALNVQRSCLEAANGFQRFLRNREEWARTRDTVDLLFRVTGLALNTIHCFVKWGYFVNDAGRAVPWKQLHALYSLAEADGYSQVPFVMHASQPSFKPSVQSLYLRTLLLDLLNAGNLTRVQVEIADGWFSSWCGDYALDAEYSRSHLFVDLASDSGLHLMRKDSHGDTVRYVRADGLKAQIEEVQAGCATASSYAGRCTPYFLVEEHVFCSIIEKLYASIVAGSENRIEERTHFEDHEVDVVVGMDRVLEAPGARALARPRAGAARPGHGRDGRDQPVGAVAHAAAGGRRAGPRARGRPGRADLARARPGGSKGYGLLVDRAGADAVMLNGLIALRNQETGGWILGSVVRKLANRVRGEMLAGVEVLAYRPPPLSLAPVAGHTRPGDLPARPGHQRQARCAARAHRRFRHRQVLPPGRGRRHLHHPAQPHHEEGRGLAEGPLRDRVEGMGGPPIVLPERSATPASAGGR